MVPFPRTTPSPDHPAGKSPPHFFPEGGVPKQIICLIWKKKNNKMQQNSNAWRVAPSSILRAKRKHILTLESVFALRSQYSEKNGKNHAAMVEICSQTPSIGPYGRHGNIFDAGHLHFKGARTSAAPQDFFSLFVWNSGATHYRLAAC